MDEKEDARGEELTAIFFWIRPGRRVKFSYISLFIVNDQFPRVSDGSELPCQLNGPIQLQPALQCEINLRGSNCYYEHSGETTEW